MHIRVHSIGTHTTHADHIDLDASICELYGNDIDKSKLERQLKMVPDMLREVKKSNDFRALKSVSSIFTIAEIFKSYPMYGGLFSEIFKLVKIFMTIPVSTASAERSFSALRRLKTYLRSNMTQCRLNHVLILHCHKDRTDDVDLQAVAREFVLKNDVRKNYFGKF